MPKYSVSSHETYYYSTEVEAPSLSAAHSIAANLDWDEYDNDHDGHDWAVDEVREVLPPLDVIVENED